MLSHAVGSFRGTLQARFDIRQLTLILLPILLALVSCIVSAQTEVQNLAVGVNGLANRDLDISPSLSIVDLDDPDFEKAVENEIISLGSAPNDIQVQGNLAYVVNTFSDNVQIIDLLNRISLGEIPIGPGTLPEKIAFLNEYQAYVVCNGTDEVRVLNVVERRVLKAISVGPAPWGIAILHGKAYVANSAAVWNAVAQKMNYGDSSVTVIDTISDTVLKTIPMPLNTTDVTSDGHFRVLALSTGDFGVTLGSLVIINGDRDEIEKTVRLQVTPSHTPVVDSRGRAYIGSSAGMLVYDLLSGTFLHDRDEVLNAFGSGFGMALDAHDNVYITVPDWSGGKFDELRVKAANDILTKVYRVGSGASFVAIAQIQPTQTSVGPRDKMLTRLGDIKSHY